MGSSRIRLYSRLAAATLAVMVAFGVSLLRVSRVEPNYNSLTITSYIVSARAPERRAPPPKPSDPSFRNTIVAPTFISDASEPRPRLWSYDAHGDIVFDHVEQYRRCVDARAAHHNEADCPEPHDAHPLILRP